MPSGLATLAPCSLLWVLLPILYRAGHSHNPLLDAARMQQRRAPATSRDRSGYETSVRGRTPAWRSNLVASQVDCFLPDPVWCLPGGRGGAGCALRATPVAAREAQAGDQTVAVGLLSRAWTCGTALPAHSSSGYAVPAKSARPDQVAVARPAMRPSQRTSRSYRSPTVSGARRPRRDSNAQPADSKSVALSIELRGRDYAPATDRKGRMWFRPEPFG